MRPPPLRRPSAAPSGAGCADCDEAGGWWVHLRRCAHCGHVGCCDSSPAQHATAHCRATGHPIVQSYEPGETGSGTTRPRRRSKARRWRTRSTTRPVETAGARTEGAGAAGLAPAHSLMPTSSPRHPPHPPQPPAPQPLAVPLAGLPEVPRLAEAMRGDAPVLPHAASTPPPRLPPTTPPDCPTGSRSRRHVRLDRPAEAGPADGRGARAVGLGDAPGARRQRRVAARHAGPPHRRAAGAAPLDRGRHDPGRARPARRLHRRTAFVGGRGRGSTAGSPRGATRRSCRPSCSGWSTTRAGSRRCARFDGVLVGGAATPTAARRARPRARASPSASPTA